jgi:integrase
MLEKIDIYNIDKSLDRYTQRIKESTDLGERSKEQFLEFKDHLFMRGLSKPRVLKYLCILLKLNERSKKELCDLTKRDVEGLIAEINQSNYAAWTKLSYRLVLKKFLTWRNGGKIPESIEWVKIHFNRSENKLPESSEMITEEEVNNVMSLCDNIRDRCLISVLYESGCRAGELASMRIGNVNFDEHGVVITVIGKTGSRKIRLVKSTAYLKMYIENHPKKEDPRNALWINIGNLNKSKPMVYSGIVKIVRTAFKRAGINKRCNLHMFRHSRATQMANHLTEFQMNHYFGWIQGSDMPSTYVHLSGKDVDKTILSMNGIVEKEEKQDKFQPIKCVRCDFINPAKTKYCIRCSQILDDKTAAEHQEIDKKRNMTNMILNELVKQPDVQKILLQKVAELGLSPDVISLK